MNCEQNWKKNFSNFFRYKTIYFRRR